MDAGRERALVGRTTSPVDPTAPLASDDRPFARITAEAGWNPLDPSELWLRRELIFFLVWRQVKTDFRQMALGPLWLVIRPILSVVIYTLIFSSIAKLPSDGLPYPLFCFSAVILWTFFVSSVQAVSTSLVANQQLLGKIYFPRLVFPIVGLLTHLVPLAVSLLVLLVAAAWWGYPPRWTLLLVPAFVSVAGLTALAIGLWAAPWVVYFRDVSQALDYGLLCWMYLTPVVYSMAVVPEHLQPLYWANPLTGCVQGLRWAVFGAGQPPGLISAAAAGVVVLLALGGVLAFGRRERTIVDVI